MDVDKFGAQCAPYELAINGVDMKNHVKNNAGKNEKNGE
jgi:hypothetical protein